jgi:amino acid transporter
MDAKKTQDGGEPQRERESALQRTQRLLDKILGRPLRTSEEGKEKLSVWTGVPALGLDALASTAYGPEAALTILMPLGISGLYQMPAITLGILALLMTLYLSYRQTAAAYPDGGGAYIVAKDNLGTHAGVVAGSALLLDYMLNVAVGISAGVGAIVSAVPALHNHTLVLCLLVLMTLTIVNLRGVRESGASFAVPVLLFVASVGIAMVLGIVEFWRSGGQPAAVVAPPQLSRPTEAISLWLVLRAFASGCTAMTGVEAVSNGVPLFRKPVVPNAQWTLTVIVVVLGAFLIGISTLCPAYHIHAMDEREPGYQTIFSQLVAAVAGRGVFYYISIASIFIVLTYSAQTSFADFPRVCRLLAEDSFLPPAFANRGRRLVFSLGINVLALLSGLILIAFGGITDRLIPLFAIGAFSAFVFSQAGMVLHWRGKGGRGARLKLAVNALGAVSTSIALLIIIVAKFIEGAWVTLLVVPGLVLLFHRIKRHYKKITQEIDWPLKLKTWKVQPPVVIILIAGWDRVAERALRFGLLLSNDITAVHVVTEQDDPKRLRELWAEKVEEPARAAGAAVPALEIIRSPFRKLYEPLLKFVSKIKEEKPGRLIAVIIPELVEPHWYGYLLHNLRAATLRPLLFLERDQRTVVITVPWHLHKE